MRRIYQLLSRRPKSRGADSYNWHTKLHMQKLDKGDAMRRIGYLRALTRWAFLIPGVCAAQHWQGVYKGSVSCKDQAAIMSFMPGDYQKGISRVSLTSGLTQWQSIPNETTELQPVIAGNTAAILTNECHTIVAFDANTGHYVWQKANWSNILESDGKYFYVQAGRETAMDALDPATGDVVWSLHLPHRPWLIYSYHIHDGRLYTADFVIDLSRRAIVHYWPKNLLVHAMAFDEDGRTYVGDPSGMVRIYSRAFKLLREIRVGRGKIVGLARARDGNIAVSYEHRSWAYDSVFKVVTRQGRMKWQLAWHSRDRLDAVGFVFAGRNVVLIEPDPARNRHWLVSRKLSTGRINWKADGGTYDRPLGIPMVLCGNTIYASGYSSIHAFEMRTGVETINLK